MKKFQKIQYKLVTTYFILTFIIVTFMVVCFYQYIYTQITDDLKASRIEVVSHTASTVDHLTDMLLFAISIGPFQSQFQSILAEELPEDPYEQHQLENQAAVLFRNYSDTYQNLKVNYYTTLIGLNGFQYSNAAGFRYDSFRQAPWMDAVLEANGQVVWIPTMEDSYAPFSSKNIYIMSRTIRTGHRLTPAGILSIMIDEDSLYKIYASSESADASYFIVDQEGAVISHKDKALIGTHWDSPVPLDSIRGPSGQSIARGGEAGLDNLYSYHKLNSSGWWLVESVPMSTLIHSSSRFLDIILIAAIICLISGLLFSYAFSRYISRPIVELDRGMERIAQGDLQLRLPKTSQDELGSLIDGFNRMSRELDTLLSRIREQERHKRKAEIGFLQAQINPHFIYNTLNSIRCMTLMQNTEEAAKMLVSVISMMRTVLDTRKMFVPLDTELSSLENYLEIQKVIYSQKLEMELDISPNVHMSMVPKLILQPIVENSVFHGIMRNNLNGVIHISAYREDADGVDLLHLVVTDNGRMEPGTLKELQHRLEENQEDSLSNGNHIGLTNILRRIKQIYGEEYGLTITETANGSDSNGAADSPSHTGETYVRGTSVHLWFPNRIYDPETSMEEML